MSIPSAKKAAGSGAAINGAGSPEGQDSNLISNEEMTEGDEGDEGTVRYSSHRKAIDQLKQTKSLLKEVQEQFAAHLAKEKEREHGVLEANGDYQKLLAAERDARKTLEAREAEALRKLSEHEKRETDRRKFAAFVDQLGVQVNQRLAWQLADLDEVVVDPESGEVDKISIQRYADKFRKEWPDVIAMASGKSGLPNGKPGAGQVGKDFISRAEYVKLCQKDTKAAAEWGRKEISKPGTIID